MLIELVYRTECPNQARRNLLNALAAPGVPARSTEWDSAGQGAPVYARHSPTVLVNTHDVAADNGVASSDACRLYRWTARFDLRRTQH
jgi:hypothetical protein